MKRLIISLLMLFVMVISLTGCYPHNSSTCSYVYRVQWLDNNHNGQHDFGDTYHQYWLNVSPAWKYWC